MVSNDYVYEMFISEPFWTLIDDNNAPEFASCLQALKVLRSLVKRNRRPSEHLNRQIIMKCIALKRALNYLYSKPLKNDTTFEKLLQIRNNLHNRHQRGETEAYGNDFQFQR